MSKKNKLEMPFKKNDIVNVKITSLSSEGNGVVKYESVCIFVPNSAVGDEIECIIVKIMKNYAFGKIKSIIHPSADRVQSDCEISTQCGGCAFRHISYKSELESKKQRVIDAFQRIGGFTNLQIDDVVSNESPDRYRNKAQYPVSTDKDGKLIVGFYGLNSHRVVKCEDCLLQPLDFSQIVNELINWANNNGLTAYNEFTGKGLLRHIYLRKSFTTGDIMLCIVINEKMLPNQESCVQNIKQKFSQIKSIIINENRENTNVVLGKKCTTIYGNDSLQDELCGLKFNISPLSFYQVNRNQAQKLYNIAGEYAQLNRNDILLDLYCGTGTIGLSMANRVKKIIGVEIISQAIDNAKINARENNITNSEFICGDASSCADKLQKSGEKPTVVILDPPRKGCESDLLEIVATKFSPERVVYISCDVATQARDCKIMSDLGYKIEKATPVDMFSRSAHVECVVLLSKVQK